MSDIKTVKAQLSIRMLVTCPNKECDDYIDLLNGFDTNDYDHNDEGQLMKQMFPKHGSHDDFTCTEVTCSQCKTTFDVKGLEW